MPVFGPQLPLEPFQHSLGRPHDVTPPRFFQRPHRRNFKACFLEPTRRCVGAKKIVRLHRFFLHQISLESKLNGRQKVKGGHGSISASISTSLIASLIASLITLNLGVGCAPSCWPIFGFRNLLGARRGHRGQFSVQSDSRFSGRGGGVGSLPRAWRRVGVPRRSRC